MPIGCAGISCARRAPCSGRLASFLPPEAIQALFRTTNPLPNAAPNYNMAPTQDALVARRHPEAGERHLDVLRWGLVPRTAKDAKEDRTNRPINARAETVARNAYSATGVGVGLQSAWRGRAFW